MAKIYRFPDLISVYHWLNEVREWYTEKEFLAENIAEDCIGNDENEMWAINANSQIQNFTRQIESNLTLVAHELIPEETENLDDVLDFMLSLFFEDMMNEDIVRSVLDARRELIASGNVQ